MWSVLIVDISAMDTFFKIDISQLRETWMPFTFAVLEQSPVYKSKLAVYKNNNISKAVELKEHTPASRTPEPAPR